MTCSRPSIEFAIKGSFFKLRQYGINGNIIDWISNYLFHRRQHVFVVSHPLRETANKEVNGIWNSSIANLLIGLIGLLQQVQILPTPHLAICVAAVPEDLLKTEADCLHFIIINITSRKSIGIYFLLTTAIHYGKVVSVLSCIQFRSGSNISQWIAISFKDKIITVQIIMEFAGKKNKIDIINKGTHRSKKAATTQHLTTGNT